MTSSLLYNPSAAISPRSSFFPAKARGTPGKSRVSGKEGNWASKKAAAAAVRASVAEAPKELGSRAAEKKLRILVAGGGIGGLVFALAAKRKGFDVVVFERDLSAIRGEGQYRGPIQIQSNALAALEAIDMGVAEEVLNTGCITGDRINGLVDGISGNWYVKFDTFTPAAERGLPVTRVISRMTLQQILAAAVGPEIIMNESNVMDFVDDGEKVTVKLENGESYEGDLLVGADGIWSKVRKNLFGQTEPIYSGYTCYTGIADFVPADIETVGYRVFLGHKQYFVSSDVGGGKMQWYAFYNEAPGGVDDENGKKARLLKLFKGWCDNVMDLLLATDEEAILRRDIYDRSPILSWGKGRVTLLGDSVHAMQPNLGQGGCMAIEDGYQLALELDKATRQSIESGSPVDIVSSLRSYENARKLRVAIIHGLARMAAIMASTYKAYLGVGLGPLSFLTQFRIPHPGRVGGRFFIDIGMPLMLSWVLGGNGSKLEGRMPQCRLSDKASDQLREWFSDDDALERALDADWFLFPIGDSTVASETIFLNRDDNNPCLIGSVPHPDFPGVSIAIPSAQVSKMHARISCKDGAFYLTDLRSEYGTWISDNEGRRYRVSPNLPTRFRPTDVIEFGADKKVVFRVKAMKYPPKTTKKDGNELLQAV
ncbi:zeaxanthin epoxidase, chloroplastic-like [Salvia splendens]|uniref:zeaxanthin epoxidase, chloroplastic-like n=1 Tax=Salvia splendens TaxID=180675 RepID=UPI001C25D824|nr:zeaxanthin epoxidase, chloroplastic-like [Salvia splendens]